MNAKNKKRKDEKKPGTGALQSPGDGELSKWIERQFRGDKAPTSIDAYPLLRGDRETRLYHYDFKNGEKVGAERAVEVAIEIYSECQLHTDRLRKKEKQFEIVMISERVGGQATPLGSQLLTMSARVHAPAPKDGETADGEPESEALTARKLMLESVKLIHEKDRAERENEGKIVGDVLLLMKASLVNRETSYKEMVAQNLALLGKFSDTLTSLAERKVEERAVGIDEANAADQREANKQQRQRDNMWSNVMEAGMLEAVKQLGGIFPGIGQLFLAHMTGKPLPDPPKLESGTSTSALQPSPQPQLPAVPEEKLIIDRFIEAAEKRKIDATHTAAEKLFGKDDDKGNPLEPGVFSREQVALFSGVHTGALGVEALDALLPDSGKPEAIAVAKMFQASAFLSKEMLEDVTKFMSLRKAARGKT